MAHTFQLPLSLTHQPSLIFYCDVNSQRLQLFPTEPSLTQTARDSKEYDQLDSTNENRAFPRQDCVRAQKPRSSLQDIRSSMVRHRHTTHVTDSAPNGFDGFHKPNTYLPGINCCPQFLKSLKRICHRIPKMPNMVHAMTAIGQGEKLS